MKRGRMIAGLGGVVFGVCLLAAELLGSPPGGNYSRSDVAQYLAHGHQPAAFIAGYLGVASAAGLIALAAYLRGLIASQNGDSRLASLVSAASFVAGWAIVTAIVAAHAQGASGLTAAPQTIYLFSELGVAMIFGPGGIMLGFALITLALTLRKTEALPAWLRWLTLITGVAGLAAPAFFPAILLVVWGITLGGWILTTGRAHEARSPQPAVQPIV
jgi:hypothetical protein